MSEPEKKPMIAQMMVIQNRSESSVKDILSSQHLAVSKNDKSVF